MGALVLALPVFFGIRHLYAAPQPDYFFDNAVNTDPTELGNYWYDAGLSDPALELPDYSTDAVQIVSGATFSGDAILRGVGGNAGTVTGDATFYGNTSENTGTVNGIKTRILQTDIRITRDFTAGGPWTVVADNADVDVSAATYDITTSFSEINGGNFIFVNLVTSSITDDVITLLYDRVLDDASVPDVDDFMLVINGEEVAISGIDIDDDSILITVPSELTSGDLIRLSYTAGSSPIQVDADGQNAEEFSDQSVMFLVDTGVQPIYSVVVGNQLFVTNATSNTITVIDTLSDTIDYIIPTSPIPYFISAIGDKIYVDCGDTVFDVIDADTGTVIDTISVNFIASIPIVVGTKLYFADGSELGVLDSATDAITHISARADSQLGLTSVGIKLYAADHTNDQVTVIDTLSDTILGTISVGDDPNVLASVGTYVYVANTADQNVSVIDTTTDTVTDTISIGAAPQYFAVEGTRVYVFTNTPDIAVIDTTTQTVVDTISVGDGMRFPVTLEDEIFVSGGSNGRSLFAIDTNTGELSGSAAVLEHSAYSQIASGKIFVSSAADSNTNTAIPVVDPRTMSYRLPELVYFSTDSSSGTLEAGDSIEISARFNRRLQSGSTMLVELNNGSQVMLGDVSGRTLSGTFIVTGHTDTPDLAVASIEEASVTDSTDTYTRTAYDLPSSVGDFEGENSFITRNIGDGKNIRIGDYLDIDVGDNPYQISPPINGYVYVANQGSDDVSVIELESKTVADTIDVGGEPYGLASVLVSGTTYLYVANINSDDVTVINTSTNEVVETIDVGVKPYYVAAVGTKVYVTNGASNTVSVINAATNTLVDTIPVGVYPRGIKAHGTDLYVANYGDPNYSGGNYISVIDSVSDSVTDTIVLPAGSDGPRGVAVLGDTLYVTNYRSNTVSVINTATNAVSDTVDVGDGPRGVVGYNGKVYVENFDAGTLSVIDTGTNTVTLELPVGHSPSGMSVVGNDIFLSSFQDGVIRVFDTATGGLEMEEEQGSNPTSSNTPRSKDWSVADPITKPVPTPNPPVPAVNPKPDPMLCHVFTTFMRRGSKFGEVAELQTRLKSAGFDPGPADGLFGPKTELAIKNFQEKNGIIRAGYVGPKTRAALNKVCETSIQY